MKNEWKFPESRGSKNRRAKLNESEIAEIRKSVLDGATVKKMASRYAVSWITIKKVCRRNTWRNVGK